MNYEFKTFSYSKCTNNCIFQHQKQSFKSVSSSIKSPIVSLFFKFILFYEISTSLVSDHFYISVCLLGSWHTEKWLFSNRFSDITENHDFWFIQEKLMANFKNFICNIQNKLFLQIFVADAAEEVAKHFFKIRRPKTNLFKQSFMLKSQMLWYWITSTLFIFKFWSTLSLTESNRVPAWLVLT